jgi:hypothetical protein
MPAAPKKNNTKKARVSSAPNLRTTRQTSANSSAATSPPVTRKPSTRRNKETPTVPDDQQTETQDAGDVEDLTSAVAALRSNAQESQDAVDEIRTQLHQYGNDIHDLGDQVRNLVEALKASVPGITKAPSTAPMTGSIGTNPLSFIEEHLPWVESSLVTSIVAGKLDPKELILLIPLEDRPNKRGGQRSNLLYDQLTGTFATVNDTPTAYEKDFPSVEYLVYALTVYGTIRGLYDVDRTGISPAIFLHIKRVVRDSVIGNYEWKTIVGCVIAHFRKYQKSPNPEVWITTDTELFFAHIKVAHNPVSAPASRSPAKGPQASSQQSRLPRPDPSSEICKNWNNAGCSWAACTRKHICSECRLPGHKQSQCQGKGKTHPKTDATKSDKP